MYIFIASRGFVQYIEINKYKIVGFDL